MPLLRVLKVKMYLVRCDTQVKYAYAWKDTSFEGFSRETCESCGRIVATPHFRGERRLLLAEGGGNYPDLLNFTGAGERLFLLSAQAVRMLEGEAITGVAGMEKVTVRSEKTEEVREHYALDIRGCIELDFEKMGLRKKKQCSCCGQFQWNRQRLEPVVLNGTTWDGSDLCRIKSLPGVFACSERFAGFVKKYSLTGFALKRALTPATAEAVAPPGRLPALSESK